MKKLLILLIPLLFLFGCTADTSSESLNVDSNSDVEITQTTEKITTTTTEEITSSTTTTTTTTTIATTTSSRTTTTKKTTVKTTTKKASASSSNTSGVKVYKTPTGKKYHYNSHCNGGTYIETTLEEAKSLGLEPCKKCVLN